MQIPFTDAEATAILHRSNRLAHARDVLARTQPAVWSRVLIAVANGAAFYLALQMRDSPVSVDLMLAGAASLALNASLEAVNLRRRVDALTVLLAQSPSS